MASRGATNFPLYLAFFLKGCIQSAFTKWCFCRVWWCDECRI